MNSKVVVIAVIFLAFTNALEHSIFPTSYNTFNFQDAGEGDEYYEIPKYSFKYKVADPHKGDYKHHEEQRYGDNVKGEYSLLQPDGVTRTVQYNADKKGFNAHVSYSGHSNHYKPILKVIKLPIYYSNHRYD